MRKGENLYEKGYHLGNVLATISDKKIGIDADNNGQIDYYTADVVTANDFYPGGMTMPGRKYNSDKAVYGFNGKRKDNEMYGDGNAYDYGDRIYNPRAVVWLSIDKLQAKHPGESPYLFVGGSPIVFIDPDGRDRIVTHIYKDKAGNITDRAVITVKDKNEIMSIRKSESSSAMGGGGSLVYTYDWHNVGQDVTHIIGDDGKEISSSTGNEYATGSVITNTTWDSKGWAKLFIDGPERGYGGIAFYGKNGQGQETKIGSFDDLKMENIDALMAAVGSLKTTLGAKPFATLIKNIDAAKTVDEKIDLFSKAVKTAISYATTTAKRIDDLKKQLGVSDEPYTPNATVCTICGKTPHGLNDVITNKDGKPEKVITHTPGYNPKTRTQTQKNDTIDIKQ